MIKRLEKELRDKWEEERKANETKEEKERENEKDTAKIVYIDDKAPEV